MQIPEIKPGEVNMIPGGTYGPLLLEYKHCGSPDKPTIIRGEGAWSAMFSSDATNTHAIGSRWDRPGLRYITLENLRVLQAELDGVRFVNAAGITINSCMVTSCKNQGVALHRNIGSTVNGCWISGCGTGGDGYWHGVYGSGRNLTVRDNHIEKIDGFCIQLYPYIGGSLVRGNVLMGSRYGLFVWNPFGMSYEPNTILGNAILASDSGICIGHSVRDHIEGNVCRSKKPLQADDAVGLVDTHNLFMEVN